MQTTSATSPEKPPPSLKTAKPAWFAIGGLTIFTTLGILLGAGGIMRFVFPLASLAVGLFLYARYPILYIGFTWWLWFLTPLLSRVIDYRSGWDSSRLILVTPFLVTLITTITLVKYLPKSCRQGRLPFLMVIAAIGYGTMIGLINNQPVAVARSFLDWFPPIPFAFHLWVNWRKYPQYRKVIQSTFLWGVLITGAYGIFQYLIAPEWDRFWLTQSGMGSLGYPEPLGIRVWSTMNSPGPFAIMIQAGLLLLFTHKSPLRFPAAVFGALSILLSLLRSAWGGFVLAMLLFLPSLKSKIQLRIISTVLILGLCIMPLVTIEPFASQIADRFQTFTNIEQDSSFKARQSNYDKNLQVALSQFQGTGLGHTWSLKDEGGFKVTVIDSGILELFSTFGWIGALFYLAGLILTVRDLFVSSQYNLDPFIRALRALILSYCAMTITNNTLISLGGMILWAFIGITLAGNKFYFEEHKSKSKFQ